MVFWEERGGGAMSFQEKSAWACLVSIVGVFVPYLVVVLREPMAFVGLFPLAVLVQVLLLGAFHAVNAIVTRSIRRSGETTALDELDRLIELRAAKVAGVVLSVVVMSWCLLAMVGAPVLGVNGLRQASAGAVASSTSTAAAAGTASFQVPVTQALVAVHLLFAGFVVANVVYYGVIIWGYRRLARG